MAWYLIKHMNNLTFTVLSQQLRKGTGENFVKFYVIIQGTCFRHVGNILVKSNEIEMATVYHVWKATFVELWQV